MNKKKVLNSIALCAALSWGQNSAPSAHFNIQEVPTHDIRVAQFRVPQGKNPVASYYQTTGFWGTAGGSTGSGYGGIQNNGKNVHIFSIWHSMNEADKANKENYPYPVYLGHGQVASYFSGEGVGLKTMNHSLGWQTDVWYTSVARVWSVGNESHYGYFFHDPVSGKWRHLTTLAVKYLDLRFSGHHNFFIEDWRSTGQNKREYHLRNNLVRSLTGNWVQSSSNYYSVNARDLQVGGRSYNYRTNFNAGVREDSTGQFYFMTSGGSSTVPQSPLGPTQTRALFYAQGGPDNTEFTPAKITRCNATFSEDSSKIFVDWDIDSTTLPQFSYSLNIYNGDTTQMLIQKKRATPHIRNDSLDLQSILPIQSKYVLELAVVDIFDNQVEPVHIDFGEEPVGISDVAQTKNYSPINTGNAIISVMPRNDGFLTVNSLSGRLLFRTPLQKGVSFTVHPEKLGLSKGIYLVTLSENGLTPITTRISTMQ